VRLPRGKSGSEQLALTIAFVESHGSLGTRTYVDGGAGNDLINGSNQTDPLDTIFY